MPLVDEVTSRVPSQILISLTRPKDETATQSVDTTRLGIACSDAEAEVASYVGVTWADYSSDRRFIRLAVEWVLLILREDQDLGGAGNEKLAAEREKLEKRAQALAKVTSRDRILPETSSELTIEPEVEAGEERGPAFTERFWERYRPEPRQAGG